MLRVQDYAGDVAIFERTTVPRDGVRVWIRGQGVFLPAETVNVLREQLGTVRPPLGLPYQARVTGSL